MNKKKLAAILQDVAPGRVTVEAAVEALRILPCEELGFARPNHHPGRCHYPLRKE
ncbi:MAG: hypothetical protein AB1402_01570 [Bacillota bacterium]